MKYEIKELHHFLYILVLILTSIGVLSWMPSRAKAQNNTHSQRVDSLRSIASQTPQLAKRLNIEIELAKALGDEGRPESEKESIRILQAVIQQAGSAGLPQVSVRAYVAMAWQYEIIGGYELEALRACNLAERMLADNPHPETEVYLYKCKALILEKIGQRNEALVYVEKALAANGPSKIKEVSLILKGRILDNLGRHLEAWALFTQLEARPDLDTVSRTDLYYEMMLHGRRTGNAELQARYADKWVAAFDSANAVLTEIYCSLRAEAAAALGDFQTAYHLATKGKDLVWRLAEHRAAPELQDARARLQTSLAEQEAQLLELKVNNRNLLIAIALSVTAVLGVGLLVLMIRARLLRTRQLLANQTANLAKQEAQLAQAEAIEMKLKADAAEKERELAMLRETDARLKADIQIAQAATERQKAQLNLELTVQRLQERRNLLADLTTRLRAAAASESGLQLRVFRLADHLSEEADAEDIDELVKLAEQNFFQYLDTFYSSLQARATDLTPYDLKLAGLLRMGKSSKQIASILGITTASVDNSRSRLRQKLNLEPDVNLQNWLRGLGNQ